MVPLGPKPLHVILVLAALVLAGCSGPADETPGATVGTTPAASTPALPVTTPTITPPAVVPPVQTPLPDPMSAINYLPSVDGVLTDALVQARSPLTLDGTTYYPILFDQKLIPDVWRLNPGDTIKVSLVASPDLQGEATGHQHGVDDTGPYTNLHFHGLNVPPQAPGDDVFIEVFPPGTNQTPTTYDYTVNLPLDHPEGLFWFHPHPHGYSDPQVIGGMSGAMIVGNVTKTYYPYVNYTEERVFLLREFMNSTPTNGHGPAKAIVTLNGLTSSAFEIAPNETQFWRFANTGADLYYNVSLLDAKNNPVPFYLISVDGNVLDATREITSLFLHPGGRMEGFIVGPPEGNYTLVSSSFARGGGATQPPVILSAVTSKGTAPPTTPASVLEDAKPVKGDPRLDLLRDYAEKFPNVTDNRTFAFTTNPPGGPFGINNIPYNASSFPVVIQQGAIEIWNITNPNSAVPHVFHIHQLDFLVLNVNGVPAPQDGVQDTVLIPAGAGSYVHVAIPFIEDHTVGDYVFHCHILAHEDKGMMMNVRVLPTIAKA